MRVAVGSDHAGFDLKEILKAELAALGHDVTDLGTHDAVTSVDYPDYGAAVGRAVATGEADLGICVCGTGNGIAMAANKVPGVRAAVVHDVTTAALAGQHNHANVVCFGARTTGSHRCHRRAARLPRRAPREHPRRTAATSAASRSWPRSTEPPANGRGRRERTRPPHRTRRNDMSSYDDALAADPEVDDLIGQELNRQQTTLQLIASENFTSPAVLAATGSVLTNKYSEGYPGRRYYGGNFIIDEVEDLARDRATSLFGAEHANVQPHAGANANLAVYQALLEPGATVLAMRLDHGGHLTHGSPASIVSKFWRFVSYGVTPESNDPETGPGEVIDFDQVAHLAKTEKPALIVAGSTAYARIIDPQPFREIADSVGALFMFDAAHPAGLIAGGAHPSPVGIADVVTLTTHKTLRGPRGGAILCGEDLAKKIDSAVFPGLQGGPLEHVIAAKAVAFAEAARPEFRQYAAQVVANAKALADALVRPRLPPGLGRHRQPHAARRPAPLRRRPHRQGGPGGARPRRHHLQPQHHPRRPALAVPDVGAPARHRGRDDGGHGPGRDADRRRPPRAHAQGPQRRGGDRDGAVRGRRALRRVPALSRPLGVTHARHRLVRPDPGGGRRRRPPH